MTATLKSLKDIPKRRHVGHIFLEERMPVAHEKREFQFRIATKLLLLLLIPVAGMLIPSAIMLNQYSEVATNMEQTDKLVNFNARVSAYVHSLQKEAGKSVAFLTGKASEAELKQARGASDETRAAVAKALLDIPVSSIDTEVGAVLKDGMDKADQLQDIRPKVSTKSISVDNTNPAYTGAIVRLLDFSLHATAASKDSEVTRNMLVYAYLLQAAEASSAARANAAGGFSAGKFSNDLFAAVVRFVDRQKQYQGMIDFYANAEQRAFFHSTYAGQPVDETNRMLKLVADAGPNAPISDVSPEAWLSANAARMDLYAAVEKRFEQDMIDAAAKVLKDADSNYWLALASTGVLLTITLLAAAFATRSLTRPVHGIIASMKKLATGDRIAEIPFKDRSDEMGDIARAVEQFRIAAVGAAQVSGELEENRKRSERERVAAQEKAEQDAAERLRIATSGLAQGLRRLASGDLTFQLNEPFAADFEALRHDFNASVSQLGKTLSAMAGSISALDSGTREISSGASDLSKRTEQQAASLEQTAAALDEITANVSNSSKRTEEARQAATLANHSAAQSVQVVSHAEDAMQKIEASSQQISNIIGVIDEIAFQTNLLALNAGVEAARAGDAGKGFAVVAQEVRELAQRSAQAAKEIKSLIHTSSSEVEGGVRLVRETGIALKTIGEQISDINRHMEGIATSAKEQSIGLAEVNAAVNSMDQTTQQNTAMVEQSTAASASLAEEAAKLRALVAQFSFEQSVLQVHALQQTARAMDATSSRNALRAAPARKPSTNGNLAVANSWEEF
ncbi:methyl-accepting chemotaxis protein [Rhizobium leguminosarum]|uniref:Methyl-accepting chemotaxis protein n=1 Tax=Rhizobium leguminosarum TaxID=384 RepID=A0AAE2SYP3_RHILE|nr:MULTISPECIES: methyl-accepting chemotaxis protein [Rhizobium]MBB4292675.1 methyl-accepting chemotaxis protein [Rhizobium leguminosarum]MBB4298913.1 methyl-accepting chemotaxis protein [Rhizobium leguminosarum]MBB4310114.1 methyl-accepting chemotaxis protein [Rhizobium leguminosarum]MBB4434376.1 methyl-accepting chemotaxis protein [Rhizobium esperanzae]MBB4531272.1 methyl-accepting chemotaxis protein [Rhizobium leguminosarum]